MDKDGNRKIQEIKDFVKKYCEERDWDQFHSAKELAIALSIEASELLAPFRFKSEKEIEELFKNPKKKEEIEDEMADVLYFLTRLAQRYDIDLAEAFDRKMDKNAKRYPVEKAKGSNKKYNEL
ncbi:MAG: nucleotide pyrophosphohydrolase [Nanoarchaeota archaeon]